MYSIDLSKMSTTLFSSSVLPKLATSIREVAYHFVNPHHLLQLQSYPSTPECQRSAVHSTGNQFIKGVCISDVNRSSMNYVLLHFSTPTWMTDIGIEGITVSAFVQPSLLRYRGYPTELKRFYPPVRIAHDVGSVISSNQGGWAMHRDECVRFRHSRFNW